MGISELAVIGKGAKLGTGVEVGPYAIIEDGAEIGAGVKIGAHAYIFGGTSIGDETIVHVGAVLGNVPQDLAFKNTPTFLKIGKRNVIREHVTIHRGTEEGSITTVGDGCFFMVNSHLGHNCHVGNNVIIANGALLAGHVEVGDNAFISGNVVIHQFCRIGKLAMIGGFSAVNKDVPPFMLLRGPSVVRAVNLVGIRRAKFSKETIRNIREAFKILYMSDLNTVNAVAELRKLETSPEIEHLIAFVLSSKRGICKSKESDEEFFG